MMMTSYQWWGYQRGDCEWGDVRGCLRGLGDNSCKRRGLYSSELSQLIGCVARGGYDQGMGNRGEVFMTWEGFEPGTWSLELWDLKQFELRTL